MLPRKQQHKVVSVRQSGTDRTVCDMAEAGLIDEPRVAKDCYVSRASASGPKKRTSATDVISSSSTVRNGRKAGLTIT